MDRGLSTRRHSDDDLPATPESWLPNEHSLYRPRHSRRQRSALTCAFIFFLAPLLVFVAGVRAKPFENHPLAPFPSFAAGWDFFPQLTSWATDHLPLRQAAVNAAEAISTGLFGDPPGSLRGARGEVGIGPDQAHSGDTQGPSYDAYPDVIAGEDGWLYLGATVRNKCEPRLDVQEIIAALRRLKAAVEASGRQFELVIAPDKATMMREHLPDNFIGKKCFRARTKAFWNRVPEALDAVKIRPALARTAAQGGQPLYYPHDTHWSYAAGLTMTRLLAEQLSPGSTTTWQVKPGKMHTWPADLARLLGDEEQRQVRGYSLAPNGQQDRTRYIASNFKRPLRLGHQGRQPMPGTIEQSVAMVADSFTQFATPFLAASFQDLTIVHTETVARASKHTLAELFADRDVIVFELVERSVAGGTSILLRDDVLARIQTVLARNPR